MGGHRAPGAGDDAVDGPVDLAAVRADDGLLDAIAGTGASGGLGAYGADYGFSDGLTSPGHVDDDRIAAVLAAWKADIEADPMPELVTLDEAVEAVTAGHEARSRVVGRTRRRMPFAIAAAAAVVAVTGLTVAVHGSGPGDTLFGVNKVLFSQHAAQAQKVHDVRQNITEANAAIARRDYAAARQALQQADIVLPAIAPQEQAPLTAERDKVQSSLSPSAPNTPPGTTPSGTSSSTSGRPSGPGTSGSGQPPAVTPSSSAKSPSSPLTTSPATPKAPEERSAPATPTTTTPTNGLSSSSSTSTTG